MQVKLIITTLAFMLTMVVFGVVALGEPARLAATTASEEALSIEQGALIFKSNCTSCHGLQGKAQECYGPDGESIGCAGRALNNRNLVCGANSRRMQDLQWTGSKYNFIHDTLNSGRPWNGMPTWGADYGGPLLDNEIRKLTLFIMNWENEELCAGPDWLFPYPGLENAFYDLGFSTEPYATAWDDFSNISELPTDVEIPEDITVALPVSYPGDAERGLQLYEVEYGCAACHGGADSDASWNGTGPWSGLLSEMAGERIDGYTAEQYVYESIIHPNAFVVAECPNGACAVPSAMPGNFGERMTNPQDIADIMTWLLQR